MTLLGTVLAAQAVVAVLLATLIEGYIRGGAHIWIATGIAAVYVALPIGFWLWVRKLKKAGKP